MKTLLKKLILSFVLIFDNSMNIGANVVSYKVPKEEPLSSDYRVEVYVITIPDNTASTQHHDKKYSIAYFDFSGTVTITVKSNFQLSKLNILPDKYGIRPSVNKNIATFKLDTPCDISFEPDGPPRP